MLNAGILSNMNNYILRVSCFFIFYIYIPLDLFPSSTDSRVARQYIYIYIYIYTQDDQEFLLDISQNKISILYAYMLTDYSKCQSLSSRFFHI